MDLIIQIIGILGMAAAILSFQCKSNKIFYLMQGLSGACFAIHFFLLGNATAGWMNAINILRGTGFGFLKKKPRTALALLVSVLYIVATALSYSSWVDLLLVTVQVTATVTMWTDNAVAIRYLQFFFVSPSWLYQNVLTGSLGGILCECFNLGSVVVSFFRFGFRGEKREAKKA